MSRPMYIIHGYMDLYGQPCLRNGTDCAAARRIRTRSTTQPRRRSAVYFADRQAPSRLQRTVLASAKYSHRAHYLKNKCQHGRMKPQQPKTRSPQCWRTGRPVGTNLSGTESWKLHQASMAVATCRGRYYASPFNTNTRALVIRIGFWGPLCCKKTKNQHLILVNKAPTCPKNLKVLHPECAGAVS